MSKTVHPVKLRHHSQSITIVFYAFGSINEVSKDGLHLHIHFQEKRY